MQKSEIQALKKNYNNRRRHNMQKMAKNLIPKNKDNSEYL